METLEWYIEQMLEGFGVAMKDLSWRRDEIVSGIRRLDPNPGIIDELGDRLEDSENLAGDLEEELDAMTDKNRELEDRVLELEDEIRELEQKLLMEDKK